MIKHVNIRKLPQIPCLPHRQKLRRIPSEIIGIKPWSRKGKNIFLPGAWPQCRCPGEGRCALRVFHGRMPEVRADRRARPLRCRHEGRAAERRTIHPDAGLPAAVWGIIFIKRGQATRPVPSSFTELTAISLHESNTESSQVLRTRTLERNVLHFLDERIEDFS